MDRSIMSRKSRDSGDSGKNSPRENATGENALYVFNRLIRMATENELSTWKQNQVRKFLRHDEIEEILELSDDFGRSVLDNACIAGNLRLVQLLLPKGAKMRKTQVTMALVCSHVRILDTLLADNPELAKTKVVVGSDTTETMPLLNYCAKIGNERALTILFKHNFSDPESIVMSLDSAGNTPLHMAQKEEVAAQLLNRVVDVKAVLKITNRRGLMPVHSIMERYNAAQRSINFGINSEELQLEHNFTEKTIVLYNRLSGQFPTSKPKASPGHLSINTDGRQVAAETMQSILQRRFSQIQQPHRGNIPKPYSDRDYLSAVAARRRVLQQQQGGRYNPQQDQRHNIAGASATIQQQQQQQLYESSAYHRQSHIVGEPASMESIQNKLAMERHERYNDTALALSEYAREWDPRREHQAQQQQLHQQQDYLSGLKIGNSSWKEAAAAAMVGGTPSSSARMYPHLNSHVPSIPAESFRLTLGGMRPASPLAASIAHSVLRRISPGEATGSPLSARLSARPKLGNEQQQEQQQHIYHQQQKQHFFPPS